MMSSAESLSTGTQRKDGVKVHSILRKIPDRSNTEEDNKLTGCELLRKKCLGDDPKPSAGMCMIAFAIPLLIPGVTLTAVAFDDETGFSKYSALHIVGMVMLGLAILLIIVGVLLNIRFKSKVGPQQGLHAVSTHEKLHGDKVFVTNIEDDSPKHSEAAERRGVNVPSLNFMADSGNNEAGGDHHVHFQTNTVGASSAVDAVPVQTNKASRQTKNIFSFSLSDADRDSSSYDSSDSDDYSSGSYIISEDVEGVEQSQGYVSQEGNVSDTNELQSAPDITTSGMQKQNSNTRKNSNRKKQRLLVRQLAHSASDTNIRTGDVKGSFNFFHDSGEFNSPSTLQGTSSQQEDISHQDSISNNNQPRNRPTKRLAPFMPHVAFGAQDQPPSKATRAMSGCSPASRQRLQALSSEVQTTVAETHPPQRRSNNSSSERISSGSNSSVFSIDKDLTAIAGTNHYNDNGNDGFHSDSDLESEQHSVNAPVPLSLPKKAVISGSSGPVAQDNSLMEKHTASPTVAPKRKSKRSKKRLSRNRSLGITGPSKSEDPESYLPLPADSPVHDECFDAEPTPLPRAKSRTYFLASLTGSCSDEMSVDKYKPSSSLLPSYSNQRDNQSIPNEMFSSNDFTISMDRTESGIVTDYSSRDASDIPSSRQFATSVEIPRDDTDAIQETGGPVSVASPFLSLIKFSRGHRKVVHFSKADVHSDVSAELGLQQKQQPVDQIVSDVQKRKKKKRKKKRRQEEDGEIQ